MSRTLPLESSLRLGRFESIRAVAISSRYSASEISSVSGGTVDASRLELSKGKMRTYTSTLRQFARLYSETSLSKVFSAPTKRAGAEKASQLRHVQAFSTSPITGRDGGRWPQQIAY